MRRGTQPEAGIIRELIGREYLKTHNAYAKIPIHESILILFSEAYTRHMESTFLLLH